VEQNVPEQYNTEKTSTIMSFVFSLPKPFFSIFFLLLSFVAFFLIFPQCPDPQVRVRGLRGAGEVEAKLHEFLTLAQDGNE
jgi:hypothetical protein